MFYSALLISHNLTRWLVIVAGIWALYRIINGRRGQRAWTEGDSRSLHWFAGILAIQFVFGATLYLLPNGLVTTVLSNMEWMVIQKNRVLRFFTLEHPIQMLIAISLVYSAWLTTRRMTDDRRKFRRASTLVVIAMLLILTAIPWPFLDYNRPWLRLR